MLQLSRDAAVPWCSCHVLQPLHVSTVRCCHWHRLRTTQVGNDTWYICHMPQLSYAVVVTFSCCHIQLLSHAAVVICSCCQIELLSHAGAVTCCSSHIPQIALAVVTNCSSQMSVSHSATVTCHNCHNLKQSHIDLISHWFDSTMGSNPRSPARETSTLPIRSPHPVNWTRCWV